MSRTSASPLLVLLFLLCSAFFYVQGCPPDELKALSRFRSTLKDTDGMLESWKGDDCCEWIGVECLGTQEGRHVSKLDLAELKLRSVRGEIDSSLFQLTHLTYLDLSGNYFHGEIPSHLGNLSSLRHLRLHSDTSSCMKSTHGIYSHCNFYGILTISNLHWLHNLSSLEYLSLNAVDVTDGSWGSIIGSLLHLKHLDMSWCSLTAPTIPDTLLNLSSLTFLNLSMNCFTNIPSWMGKLSSLTHLDLRHSDMSGSIPNTIGNLTGLSHLYLHSNKLEGTVPPSLGDLHKLRTIDLHDNQLNGSLPLSFARLSTVTYLNLSDNYLNGTITEVFFQRSLKLKSLDLSHSGLSINISSTWIPTFQLRTLLLKKCQIGGPIPSWISTQFSLRQLDLSATQLMGSLPSWLWKIEEVDLSDNHLQGSFTPTSGSLRYLDLSMNELMGILPADIHVHLPNAEVLILADNKFEGHIPPSIDNLRNLSLLDMSNNNLTGNVPAALGNLTYLEELNVENNYLEGEIPKELGIFSNLQFLRFGKNSLQGVLPTSLKNLSRLQVLDVGSNNLAGNIPHWIANFSSLHVLVMRSNNFRGILPSNIGRMPKLQVLDLSSNSFSGTIPHSYLRFPAMQDSSAEGVYIGTRSSFMDRTLHYEYVLSSFICFDLSNNRLSGPLPPEVGNLKGLMYLNLSMNSLSGPLPESLGNLVQLESVDLSFNKFSGRIPWQLGYLTYLAHFNLSFNNLTGRIPDQGGQLVTFDESSYRGNPYLWGCPLERSCSRRVARAASPPAVSVERKRESVEKKMQKGFEFSWYVMCLGLWVGVGFGGVVMVLVLKPTWRTKCFQVMDRGIERMDWTK